eukprot:360805-Chlamydomonas_euryale.AAC.4
MRGTVSTQCDIYDFDARIRARNVAVVADSLECSRMHTAAYLSCADVEGLILQVCFNSVGRVQRVQDCPDIRQSPRSVSQ